MRPQDIHPYDTTYPSAAEWRRLTPEEQRQFVERIIAQAHAARSRAIYDLLMRIPAAAVAAVAAVWRAGAALIVRDRAIRDLSALDDRSLRDIGLNRSEIEAAVNGRGPRRGPEPFVRLERHGVPASTMQRAATEPAKHAA
jgi:uncharacterized protein YjiS (DUF1127 family)